MGFHAPPVLQMVPAPECWNPHRFCRNGLNIPHPASLIFRLHPYHRTGRSRNWTDDNICGGNPDSPHTSAPGSPADLRRTHCCMEYPGIRNVKSHDPARRLRKKRLLSSHYIQHRLRSAHLPGSSAHSASLPGGKYSALCKYSVKKRCPDRHPSGSGSLYRCSLPPGKWSYPDKSLHLRMYSESLSPAR